MTGELLTARGIERGYGRRAVLRGTDLVLHGGEVVALLGPNGAGKTTLLKVLVGVLEPSAGELRAPDEREIGWVPQGGATYGRLTVRENLELFARLLDQHTDARALARVAAEASNLQARMDTLASELSGGLRQRLNVAVGLLGEPRLLVLDEPTTGVDAVHRSALHAVLRERAAAGCAVLLTTHSLEDARAADRVVVLARGRTVYDGPLVGIAGAPGSAVVPDAAVTDGLLRMWQQAELDAGLQPRVGA